MAYKVRVYPSDRYDQAFELVNSEVRFEENFAENLIWKGEKLGSSINKLILPILRCKKRISDLADVYTFGGSMIFVNSRTKRLIDAFEPHIHEFFQVEIRDKNNILIEEKYYLLNVCQKFDALLVDFSDVTWLRATPGLEKIYGGSPLESLSPISPLKLRMSESKVRGFHLWRSDRLLTGDIYISDDLKQKFEENRIKRFDYKKIDELPLEWVAAENYGENKWYNTSLRFVAEGEI